MLDGSAIHPGQRPGAEALIALWLPSLSRGDEVRLSCMTERIRPTIESCEVVRLFPTFVWKAQLARETYEGINADVLRELDKLTRDQPIAAGEV
jgi:hypothetical protein